MKVVLAFNELYRDGMGTAAITLYRALKSQGIDVQPVHAWNDIKFPEYVAEAKPICVANDGFGCDGRTSATTRRSRLNAAKRSQVKRVVERYSENVKINPGCSLFGIAKAILRDDFRNHVSGGYLNAQSLRQTASRVLAAY